MIYIYAPEIYPTEARSTGLGLGSMAARIGGVAAPQIIPLQGGVRQIIISIINNKFSL